MTVVIDTNALVGMVSASHPNFIIYQAWMAGRFSWVVSTDILLEYEEVLAKLNGANQAARQLYTITAWGEVHSTLQCISPSFRFLAIPRDVDDNKFADCAITAHAEWIVTEDRHFGPLIGSGYKPQPITPEEFIRQVLPIV